MVRSIARAGIALVALGVAPGCSSSRSAAPTATDPADVAPPPSAQGFQLRTPGTSVPSGAEEQDCHFFRVRDVAAAAGLAPDRPAYLHRIQIAQRPGSHHVDIFRVRTIVKLDPANGLVQTGRDGDGECYRSSNWSDWPLVANTQQNGDLDWTYPDGIASELLPDEWLMVQTHYVNPTAKAIDDTGPVLANFWTIPQEGVTALLGTLFAAQQKVRVCASNKTPQFEGSCTFGGAAPVTIIGANGHFHSRGTRFDMFTWDGVAPDPPSPVARFYDSTSWDSPPMRTSPDLHAVVPPGGGIRYSCNYEWTPPTDAAGGCAALDAFDQATYATPASSLDCCYTFGPFVEKNEHCNAFVYYYPRQDGVACQ